MNAQQGGTDETPTPDADSDAWGVVALGASAGGLASIEVVLAGLPADFPWPVLVAQHMDPHVRTHFAEIVARHSRLEVREAREGDALRPGLVLVCPADAQMRVTRERTIRLSAIPKGRPQRIDILFHSLAESFGALAVGVVLSGTGNDGAEGAPEIKRRGGTIIAESEESARHPGMPHAAVQAGAVDLVRPVAEIAPLLVKVAAGELEIPPPNEKTAFNAIVELLTRRRGTSLGQYREPTLRRRIRKRMASRGIASMESYLDMLKAQPEEADHLFETILINVTEFFRDAEAWEVIEKEVVPALVARLAEAPEIRIWAAGCASGEEAYSLAMLLAEALPDPADWARVRIFATDVDAAALGEGRQARYDPARLTNVSPERLARFFERAGPLFEIAKPIRRMVIFGIHDLTRDPPIGRLDLVVCRNVLIYFDVPLQRRIFALFHYALNTGGFLFLGKSEDIPRDVRGFDVLQRKSRLFQRGAQALPILPRLDRILSSEQLAVDAATRETTFHPSIAALNTVVFDAVNIVVLVADAQGTVRFANRYARALFEQDEAATMEGTKLVDVLRTADEALRNAVQNVVASQKRARLGAHPILAAGKRIVLDLVVDSFVDHDGTVALVLIGLDVTGRHEAEDALRDRGRELQEAIEALQTTNEELQSANEELVTANEELQSSNEELATLNEELQSSNEELETTNEELQSTNEELGAVNAELTRTAVEADQLHATAEGLANVAHDAIVVCDADETITLWGRRARDFFALHENDVIGRNIYSVDLQTMTERLRDMMRRAREKKEIVESEPMALRGMRGHERWVTLAVGPLVTPHAQHAGWLLAFSDLTEERTQAARADRMSELYRALLRGTHEAILHVEPDGVVSMATAKAVELLGEDPTTQRTYLWDLTKERDAVLKLKGALIDLTASGKAVEPDRHVLSVPLRTGNHVSIEIVLVATAGAAPIVLLRPEGGAPAARKSA